METKKLAKVVTVSDSVVAGTRQDISGDKIGELLADHGWSVIEHCQIPDGIESVRDCLISLSSGFAGLIVSTGGTGFGPRDLTPEGTAKALERDAPGIAEAMRLCNNKGLGRLSRAVAGTRGQALILNTPGSAKGSIETLSAVIDIIPHAIDLLSGSTPH